jgi:cytochrome c-type biogenesis protein CcmF
MLGALIDAADRTQLMRQPSSALRRAAGLPRSTWGTVIAHFAVGMTLLGIVCESNYGHEQIASVRPSQKISVAGYELTFEGASSRQGPNYRELVAKFTVRQDGATLGIMEPTKRTFSARASSTTEAALMTRGISQLYLSLGEPNADGSIVVRAYYKPFVLLIWLGAVAMFFGGLLSLSDRRLRVGAPKPSRASVLQAAK